MHTSDYWPGIYLWLVLIQTLLLNNIRMSTRKFKGEILNLTWAYA